MTCNTSPDAASAQPDTIAVIVFGSRISQKIKSLVEKVICSLPPNHKLKQTAAKNITVRTKNFMVFDTRTLRQLLVIIKILAMLGMKDAD